MDEKVFFEGEFGKICGIIDKTNNSKEISILVHGFSSSKDRGISKIKDALEKANINTIRIDLDNRGESELDFETRASVPNYVKQIEATINYCKEKGYENLILLGTSYGGTSVFATSLKHPEIKKIIMRAPVVDYKEHAIWVYGKDKLEEFKQQGFVPYFSSTTQENLKVNFGFIENSYSYSMYEHAKEIQIPTLIIQGDEDKEVEPAGAERAIKYFPNAKLKIIKGARHNCGVNGDFTELHKSIIDFIKE